MSNHSLPQQDDKLLLIEQLPYDEDVPCMGCRDGVCLRDGRYRYAIPLIIGNNAFFYCTACKSNSQARRRSAALRLARRGSYMEAEAYEQDAISNRHLREAIALAAAKMNSARETIASTALTGDALMASAKLMLKSNIRKTSAPLARISLDDDQDSGAPLVARRQSQLSLMVAAKRARAHAPIVLDTSVAPHAATTTASTVPAAELPLLPVVEDESKVDMDIDLDSLPEADDDVEAGRDPKCSIEDDESDVNSVGKTLGATTLSG